MKEAEQPEDVGKAAYSCIRSFFIYHRPGYKCVRWNADLKEMPKFKMP